MESLGRHILVEYYNCSPEILKDVTIIEESMLEAAREANSTIINSTFHHFSPFGVSGVVVIQESHLAIHTWPEYKYAAVDLFTCGEVVDPWIAYHSLKKALQAEHGSAMEINRGQQRLLPKMPTKMDGDIKQYEIISPSKYERNIWFTERNENIALSLRHSGQILFRETTPFQKVEILDTYEYGRLLTLDGLVMTTERDEFVYHELISHVPMMSHPAAKKKALVIGGGDGGVVKELVRHSSLEKVVMVEIDEAVIRASKEFLPSISCQFNNPKVELIIGDGIQYVKHAHNETFDIIIVDSTDPIGPAEGNFSEDFYKNCYRILKKDGIFTNQSESPHYNVKVFKEIYKVLRKIYGIENVNTYLGYIATYPSGLWSFSYCAKGNVHPFNNLDISKANEFAEEHELKYYNGEMHRAVFALPPFAKNLLSEV